MSTSGAGGIPPHRPSSSSQPNKTDAKPKKTKVKYTQLVADNLESVPSSSQPAPKPSKSFMHKITKSLSRAEHKETKKSDTKSESHQSADNQATGSSSDLLVDINQPSAAPSSNGLSAEALFQLNNTDLLGAAEAMYMDPDDIPNTQQQSSLYDTSLTKEKAKPSSSSALQKSTTLAKEKETRLQQLEKEISDLRIQARNEGGRNKSTTAKITELKLKYYELKGINFTPPKEDK